VDISLQPKIQKLCPITDLGVINRTRSHMRRPKSIFTMNNFGDNSKIRALKGGAKSVLGTCEADSPKSKIRTKRQRVS
jgi:hypothetical protein